MNNIKVLFFRVLRAQMTVEHQIAARTFVLNSMLINKIYIKFTKTLLSFNK